VHDQAGLPGGADAGDEQAKASLEIKGFLGWLEGFMGARVEDLTPKTKLQSYYEHDYECPARTCPSCRS